jgi:hypothetical protein
MQPYEYIQVRIVVCYIMFDINKTKIKLYYTSDPNHKLKLISTSDDFVESCEPNPCQNGGKCITSGIKKICQCKSHFTGRFCSLTMCELDPCVFGRCELTNNGFKVCHF